MKKQILNIILCSIILLGINFTAKSQNCVGLSKTEIQDKFRNIGVELNTSVDDDGTKYLWFFNKTNDYQTYYLNYNNICYRYAVVFDKIDFNGLTEVLIGQGYKNYDDNYWRNDNFKLRISYLSSANKWCIIITLK
jgi:hypothetical protein